MESISPISDNPSLSRLHKNGVDHGKSIFNANINSDDLEKKTQNKGNLTVEECNPIISTISQETHDDINFMNTSTIINYTSIKCIDSFKTATRSIASDLQNASKDDSIITIKVKEIKDFLYNECTYSSEELSNIRNEGILLWNACTTAIESINVSSLSSSTSQERLKINAEIRLLACNITAFQDKRFSFLSDYKVDVIDMNARTGRIFHEIGDFVSAKSCFKSADALWLRLSENLPVTVAPFLFRLVTWEAENEWSLGNRIEALKFISKARDLVMHLPDQDVEYDWLANLCFNNGRLLYSEKCFDDASTWLHFSIEIISLSRVPSACNKSRFYRLLSECCLMKLDIDMALKYIQYAEQVLSTSFGVFQKIKVLLALLKNDLAVNAAIEFIQRSDITIEMAVSTCKLLAKSKLLSESMKLFEIVLTKFASDTSLQLRYLQFLLSDDVKNYDQASFLTDELSIKHNNNVVRMTETFRNQVYEVIWNAITSFRESLEFTKAATWIFKAQKLLSPNDTVNMAKCHRTAAYCLLNDGQIDKSIETAQRAKQVDSTVNSSYCLFKCLLKGNKIEQASNEVEYFVEAKGFDPSILFAALQESYDCNVTLLTRKILEAILCLDDDAILPCKRSNILLELLCLSDNEQHDASKLSRNIMYIKQSLSLISSLGSSIFFDHDSTRNKALFAHCWNLAIKGTNISIQDATLWRFCSEVSKVLSIEDKLSDEGNIAMLMALSDTIEILTSARQGLHDINEQNKEIISAVINDMDALKANLENSDMETSNIYYLLIVLEYKVKAYFKSLDLIQLQKQYISGCPARVFEMMGTISSEGSCKDVNAAIHAYRLSLNILISSRNNDDAVARNFRALIEHCKDRNEELKIFQEIILFMKDTITYPLEEIEYLITRAWNNGVFFAVRNSNLVMAERWMGISIGLTEFLIRPQNKSIMPKQESVISTRLPRMKTDYGRILSKITTTIQ